MMTYSAIDIVAAAIFTLAVVHTFCVGFFQRLAKRCAPDSAAFVICHAVGEVELVFGIWAAVFVLLMAKLSGPRAAWSFLVSRDFTEPLFVFVIMAVAATRPVMEAARWSIEKVAQRLPWGSPALRFYVAVLSLGPLLGSFITEPAAMTVTALLLHERYFSAAISERLRYATLGLLFVNISVGGVLTPFAAPPVLMVAGVWQWDLAFMLQHFGWKAVLAVVTSTVLTAFLFRGEISQMAPPCSPDAPPVPAAARMVHVLMLALVVFAAHSPLALAGVFALFLGMAYAFQDVHDRLRWRESALVAFFLAGLVVLCGPQRWWLEPLMRRLQEFPLFVGTTALTAVMDNAALTYLGAQVPNLSARLQYALVAGAVAGGGLTVIANAPNPAGYAILNRSFGEHGIQPLRLFLGALPATLVAMAFLWAL